MTLLLIKKREAELYLDLNANWSQASAHAMRFCDPVAADAFVDLNNLDAELVPDLPRQPSYH